ncbi:phosphodiester glycosidase family protein [Paenibacillus sp. NPDC056579]|uniref:phosphodiester glycosidase family protein n=1 Tax=Paenibacillus sp. NPDC056579 TaxID=3345871 RepID=UPI00369AC6A9
MMFTRKRRRFTGYLMAVVMLLSFLQLYTPALASTLPATTYGQVTDMRQMELAPGATYTWYDMNIDRGKEKMHFVEFDPKNPNLELQAGTKSGKVYGMQGVTAMANYADKPGNRVIAGINGDFYDLTGYSTGVPNGLFMDDGRILNSSTSSFAFGLKSDGTSVYGSPRLTKTVTIGGVPTNLTHINRYRENNQLVLYTSDYNTSTMTTNLGDEVVLDVLQGEVKSGQTMLLKVNSIRKDQGSSPLEPGKVVLSASGTARSLLSAVQIGDEITASFALDGEWQDVTVAIGGQGPLIKNGAVQTNVGPEGVHPRTAIGTKSDGTVVLFEIDGRAPGFSEGVETVELANILKDLGVVDAMNLDGGGSSTFVAKLPGETARKMLNRGSDGGERQTGNGLLLVNKAPEGPAAKLVVQPGMERILAGSSLTFKSAGIDAGGHPANYSEAETWNADSAIGTITAGGVFTAGNQRGSGKIRVSAGSLQGEADIEVVDQLTELQFPDEVKTFNSGAVSTLSVAALRNGQVIQASNDSFEWRVEGPIGTIDANGTFRATSANDQSGTIYVKHGSVETSMKVTVGVPPVVLEDFENGLGNYMAAGAAYTSVSINEEKNQDFVRLGNASLKLSYDFRGKTGTSGAYLQAKSTATRIQVPGYPEKIGMWVYGDGEAHWLRGQMRDGNNVAFAIDFTDQTAGVNWKGWKYIEAAVPKGKATPLTMDMPVRYMETSNTKKTAGALYIDGIRAVYGPLTEDRTPPIIKNEFPEANSVVKTNIPQIRAIGEDDGYDPVKHPGTTLIDPNTIRVYIDGTFVAHGLYPPEGRITYKPATPLDDGIHHVKMAVRDLEGNQTIKEWDFIVDTGSAKFKYATPADVYAGHSYSVELTGERIAQLRAGHLEFAFDPSRTNQLSVVKSDKLSDSHIQQQIDPATGNVRVTFSDLDSIAGLTDSDVLARITYQVKGDASGTNVIAFRSSSILLTGSAEYKNYVGASMQSAVKQELRLSWDDNYAQGLTTTFTVTDEGGVPVEGAKLLANGIEVGDGSLRTDSRGKLSTNRLTETLSAYSVQAAKGEQYSLVSTFTVSKPAGSATPNNISVTMGADPAVSRGFTWHTNLATDKTVVEVVKASEFTDFSQSNVVRFNGTSYLFNTLDIGTIRVHKATADALEPGTAYVYRVGDGEGNYSAQGSFKTAPRTGDQTEFLVFGDSQAADAAGFKIWGDTLKQAMTERPQAEFIVHVGDMVDSGFKEQEWNWWFEKAQPQLMSTTAITVVGNHEVMGTKGNGDFLAHFNHPQNGSDSQKGTNYSFDYKNIHIAVLNSEYVDGSGQTEWLRNDLMHTDKPWKIVFFHRGPYGSIYDTENVRSAWTPVFDEFGVDLVMNGHDHIYLRTYPMKNNQKAVDGKGTSYIIPGATGPKFYELTPRPWQMVVDDENTQMFSSVVIDGEKLKVVTKTIGGRVVDTFEISKRGEIASIELKGSSSLKVGQTDKAVTEAVYDSGRRTVLSEGVTYTSSVSSVATIDGAGTINAVAAGETVISATYGGKSASYKLIVSAEEPVLTGITVEGPSTLKIGGMGTVATNADYSDGSKVPVTKGVTYASSVKNVATIDGAGTINAVAAGETVISATYGGKSASYKLIVSAEEPVLNRITVEGPSTLKIGGTGTAVTQAVYSDGSKVPVTKGVTYASSVKSVATIDGAGTINALAVGETVISATYGGKSASYKLIVSAEEPVLNGITVEGPSTLKIGGTGTAVTQADYSDGSKVPVTKGVTYASSVKNVATIDGAGTINAVAAGETVISATYGGKSASYKLIVSAEEPVLNRITVEGPSTLKIGGTGTAVTQAVYSDGSKVPVKKGVTYASSVKNVATIDGAGTINALAAGETVISATYGGKSASYKLIVSAEEPVLIGITVEGPSALVIGERGTAVTNAVYSDGLSVPLVHGVNYDSSMKNVASVDEAGRILALGVGETEISAKYGDKTASYKLTVSMPRRSNSSGSGSSAPVVNEGSKPGRVEVTYEILNAGSDQNQVVIKVSDPLNEIVLPGNAAELLQNKALQVQGMNLVITIPANVLKAIAGMVPAEQQGDSTISLSVTALDASNANELLANAQLLAGAELKAAGDVLEFRLTLTTKQGKTVSLSKFEEPLTISLPLSAGANTELAGIYYIADDQTIEYIPGSMKEGMVTAPINHFSKYSVLEYNKTFEDVKQTHWAWGTIRSLAAKHLVQGMTADQFAPDKTVTRAEFAAMLVRLLGIKGVVNGTAAFVDIAPDQWYAEPVRLAAQAGIVNGIGESKFAPNAEIKRQEMAAMLMRAYAYANGGETKGAADSRFEDMTDAPDWAKQAVGAAASLGLVNGRSDSLFQPHGEGTRAESAQIIYNLYKIIEKKKTTDQ